MFACHLVEYANVFRAELQRAGYKLDDPARFSLCIASAELTALFTAYGLVQPRYLQCYEMMRQRDLADHDVVRVATNLPDSQGGSRSRRAITFAQLRASAMRELKAFQETIEQTLGADRLAAIRSQRGKVKADVQAQFGPLLICDSCGSEANMNLVYCRACTVAYCFYWACRKAHKKECHKARCNGG